ncbi:cytochrome P450 [Byssothecium circinans]|uniref:Cytochrome P450 n=1 Tax=Byssothecium circinans TaxID=147558 RepID=A0A6A5THB3_9PLEO|nr:cytochrome P450 [Byssothecium circinans]
MKNLRASRRSNGSPPTRLETPKSTQKSEHPPGSPTDSFSLLFASIHTTSHTSVNALLDIFTKSAGEICISSLRQEARHNTQFFGGRWDRARLNSIPYHDSALRESMRLSGIAVKILQRKMMAPEGIVLPNGTVLPQGTTVCVSAWGLHHDEQVYTNPSKFLPERFVAGHSSSLEEKKSGIRNPSDRKGLLLRTATEADPLFAFWGLGEQSCPGRYMAADLIKILMEYIVANYDVVPLNERPRNSWIEYNYVPSANAKLQVRRRRGQGVTK